MRHPIVHLYALCLDEAQIMPSFYSHYDPWIEHFHIFDNGSSDGGPGIIASHPRSTLYHFQDDGASREISALRMYDSAWKQSRARADWVLICDMDEHIWHENALEYLQEAQSRGMTVVRPEAYEMVADDVPSGCEPLWHNIKNGVRLRFFDKPQLFDPNAICETHFGVGRHVAAMEGNCRIDDSGEMKLLHFKQMGADYVVSRHSRFAPRLGEDDRKNGWSAHWGWEPRRIRANHRMLKAKATRLPFLP